MIVCAATFSLINRNCEHSMLGSCWVPYVHLLTVWEARTVRSRSLSPSWVETFEDLQSALTVEELWAVLLEWHGIRGSSVWEEPYTLFMRFHRNDSTDADKTAALLCTDYRWRNAAHHLIARLADAGVLDSEQLDELADWFSGEAFEISVDTSGGHRDRSSTVRRPIWPPLRRWAAEHEVSRRPERWRDVIEASRALPSRDGAATVAGVMAAVDNVPQDQHTELAELGTNHGSGTVRLAALPILAASCGTDVAIEVARRDPSAKVRAWKPTPAGSERSPSGGRPSADAVESSTVTSSDQPSLFDQ